jgi:lipopolysaccharide transport system permease protein
VNLLRNLWRWRALVLELARRDFRARYRASALGALWTVLEPAVQFSLYLFAFSLLLGTRVALDPAVAPFGLYVISGLVPFWTLQEVMTRATVLVQEHAAMVRYVRFPLEVLLAAAMASVLMRQALAFLVVVGISVFVGKFALLSLAWLVLGVVILVVLAFGAGLVFMLLGVYLPDTSRLVGVGSSALFFASPIAYPLLALVSQRFTLWLYANPLVGILALVRCAVMAAPSPPGIAVGVAIAWACATLLVGVWLFEKRAGPARDLA